MLSQRVILLCCLAVLFVGIVAQNSNRKRSNDDVEQNDDEDEEDGPPQDIKKNNPSNQENNNEKAPERAAPYKAEAVKEQPAAPAPPPPPPPPAPATRPVQSVAVARQPVTPIASSPECKADVQKYCNKGNEKILANLKVLQCIDDLDNVSIAIDPQIHSIPFRVLGSELDQQRLSKRESIVFALRLISRLGSLVDLSIQTEYDARCSFR